MAFGVYDDRLGSENVVMVCELEDEQPSPEQRKALELELRRRVVQASEVALSDVRLTEGRWLIKTSSGKISRSASREKYDSCVVRTTGSPPTSWAGCTSPMTSVLTIAFFIMVFSSVLKIE